VKGLTLTLKIGQCNRHSMIFGTIYILLVTTGCIIVNNSIFFELTSVGMYVYVCVKRTNKTNAYLVQQPLLVSKSLNILVSVDK